MAPVKRKKFPKKTLTSKTPQTGGKPSVHVSLHKRISVDPENVSFVKDCLLPHYKKARPWHFLKPEERRSVTAIASALIRNHIVTGTMRETLRSALIELEYQGVIKLPPPRVRRSRKK